MLNPYKKHKNFEHIAQKLKKTEGEPILLSAGSKRITDINIPYFSKLFLELNQCIYLPMNDRFYIYNDSTGCWDIRTEHSILMDINNLLSEYSRTFGLSHLMVKRKVGLCKDIMAFLRSGAERNDYIFRTYQNCHYIHCKNCMLVYDETNGCFKKEEFSPDFLSRNQVPYNYNENACCPKFLQELLAPLSEDDILILQYFVGQCLLKYNYSQTILLITGAAGAGKSTLVNVIENLIGVDNTTELRLEHLAGRFEVSRYLDKSLLTAKDVKSDVLKFASAKKLKALTGGDRLSGEFKTQNKPVDITGNFNIIITSNATLQIEFDDDIDAWKRRLLWIKYENIPCKQRIVNFAAQLLHEEGEGILKWAVEGAEKFLNNGMHILKTPEQNKKIEYLIIRSDPFTYFAEVFIQRNPSSTLTTSEVVNAFRMFCGKIDCEPPTERKIQHDFHKFMNVKFKAKLRTDIKRCGKNKRGYVGFKIQSPPNSHTKNKEIKL